MSLYSSLRQVLAPYAAKLNGLLTGWDGTEYNSPGEAVRSQISALHVLIGDEPGTAIQASAIGYNDSNVADELTGLNGRLAQVENKGDGLTEDVKAALLNVVAHIGAWSDSNGQAYYDALELALYPPATLVSISCEYAQSGAVYTTDTLDSLKTGLTVTGRFDNNTTAVIPAANYTLSGTLSEGTSTITVTYSGKTSTFNVIVSVGYSVTNNLTNCSNTNTGIKAAKGSTYSGRISADGGYEIDTVSVTMGGSDITSTAYSNGAITVANVTGDIVINAVAIVAPVYTSSTGKEYTKNFTYDGNINNFWSTYGTMDELEELTLTGLIRWAGGGIGRMDVGTYAPNLKKLVIDPTSVTSSDNSSPLEYFKFGHFAFSGIPATLTYLQLGSINPDVYCVTGGYFRDDGVSAGLASKNAIGNTNGIEIVIYSDAYRANGGWGGTVDANTTIKQYLYTDGSVLTA